MSRCQFLLGDVFDKMATIPDNSVDLIVTSPPFLALRSYLPADHPDKHLEIGSEATPAAFLSTLLALTREWRRILAPHGSICVELGDTYSGSFGSGDQRRHDLDGSSIVKRGGFQPISRDLANGWPLAKSLCLLPTLYPASLAYGHNLLDPTDRIEPWRIRNLIVWHRPNPPVGALGDKVRPSTSYVTVGCVSTKRWFDLDAERTAWSPNTSSSWINGDPTKWRAANEDKTKRGDAGKNFTTGMNPAGAPPLDCWIDGDVWTIPTAPYKGAHYATFPIALPRRLIRLMCPRQVCTVCGEPRRRIVGEAEYVNSNTGKPVTTLHFNGERRNDGENNWDTTGQGDRAATRTAPTLGWTDCGCLPDDYMTAGLDGVPQKYRRGHVLDPFAGSGTTLAAAAETGRDAIGIDLDELNLDLARERIGLFLEEELTT